MVTWEVLAGSGVLVPRKEITLVSKEVPACFQLVLRGSSGILGFKWSFNPLRSIDAPACPNHVTS